MKITTVMIILVLFSTFDFHLNAQFFKNNPFYQKETSQKSENLLKLNIPWDISLEASLNRFPSKQNYIFFRSDLDGDNRVDAIDFKISGKNREQFELRVNRASFRKFLDSDDVILRILDLNPDDRLKEIMIHTKSPLNRRNSHNYYFLKYSNEKLSYVGLFLDCDGMDFTGEHLEILTDMKWWVKKDKYFLNRAHLLNKVKDEFNNVDVELRLVKKLPILKKRHMNAPVYYLPARNRISVLFYTVVNGKEWYVIQYHRDMIGFTTGSVLEDCAGL